MKDVVRLVLKEVFIFDSINKILTIPQTVVIENGKFSWIGLDNIFIEQADDVIIDGANKFLFPGLFDCHVHLMMTHSVSSSPIEAVFRTKDGEKLLLALNNAQKYLVSGFTTLRDCGGLRYNTPSLRDSIASGIHYGPRLIVAEDFLTQPGDQENFGPIALLEFENDRFNVGSGVDNVIQAVRERKRRGADFIKTMTTGGVLHGKGSKIQLALWRDEELEAMVSEAERLGMYVAAHAHNSNGVLKAVKAGARTIEHGSSLNDEIIELMVKKGTFLIPTESAVLFIVSAPESVKKNLKPEVIQKWEMVSNEAIKSHKLAYNKGVNIAVGTDLPVSGDHGATAIELHYLHEILKMPSEEVFYCATIQSARALQVDDKLGSIEIGKIADCVLFEENPLLDIKIVQDRKKILKVIKDGIVMAEEGKLVPKELF